MFAKYKKEIIIIAMLIMALALVTNASMACKAAPTDDQTVLKEEQ